MEQRLDERVGPLQGADERTLKINALEDLSDSLQELFLIKGTT
jgi:hypothetical protein